ncbi:MAG: flagellar basal body rod protein FlgB [Epsilonproteobacteria bacterium]|nr:flagellar basal body rod protein FlgB [Campylobacterota bacterium]
MPFQVSKANAIASKALNYRIIKADLISSNIANIDTPGYKARDIDFAGALQKEVDKLYGTTKEKRLKLAKTDSKHLNPLYDDDLEGAVVFFRDGQDMRNDGNTVDLDVETTELAKNEMMYNATIAAMRRNSSIFRSVLDASSKV